MARRSQAGANLMRRYGITLEQYEDMFVAQDGCCAICHQSCTTGRRLAVDHDHQTGKVRALLCSHCNHGIGKFFESQDLLRRAVQYLDDHTHWQD